MFGVKKCTENFTISALLSQADYDSPLSFDNNSQHDLSSLGPTSFRAPQTHYPECFIVLEQQQSGLPVLPVQLEVDEEILKFLRAAHSRRVESISRSPAPQLQWEGGGCRGKFNRPGALTQGLCLQRKLQGPAMRQAVNARPMQHHLEGNSSIKPLFAEQKRVIPADDPCPRQVKLSLGRTFAGQLEDIRDVACRQAPQIAPDLPQSGPDHASGQSRCRLAQLWAVPG